MRNSSRLPFFSDSELAKCIKRVDPFGSCHGVGMIRPFTFEGKPGEEDEKSIVATMGQWFDKLVSRVRNKVLLSFAVVVNSSDIHPTVDEEVLCIVNCSSPKSDILFRSALDTKARKDNTEVEKYHGNLSVLVIIT